MPAFKNVLQQHCMSLRSLQVFRDDHCVSSDIVSANCPSTCTCLHPAPAPAAPPALGLLQLPARPPLRPPAYPHRKQISDKINWEIWKYYNPL